MTLTSDMRLHESARLGEKYYAFRHHSGLDVLVFPKKLSTCCAVLGTRFGSADREFRIGEKKFRLPKGTAHFLEHKLFENADGINSDEIFAELGGEDNAYTNYSATRYTFSATDRVEECLSELIRFVTHPYFTEENVEKERGIIAQEILMYRDDPYERAMENCLHAMYKARGVRDGIAGDLASIKRITPQVLYDAYGAFYRLDNMVLSICGDISPERVLDICDRELPYEVPDVGRVSRIVRGEPPQVMRNRTVCRMNVSRPVFFIGVKDPEPACGTEMLRRSLAMGILNNMLFSGTGELYNRLLDDGLITPGFSFGYSGGDGFAMNYFSGTSDEPERVLEAIRDEVERASQSLDRNDFERCRRASLAQYIRAFDSTADIADDIMLSAYCADTDPFDVPDMIEALTLEDIAILPAKMFGSDNWTLSLVMPMP